MKILAYVVLAIAGWGLLVFTASVLINLFFRGFSYVMLPLGMELIDHYLQKKKVLLEEMTLEVKKQAGILH